MSDSDQNTNAITEEQRKQQLAKLNLNVDESITASDSQAHVSNKQVNGFPDKTGDTNIQTGVITDSVNISEQTNKSDSINSSRDKTDTIQSKSVPNEIVEDIADDISDGIVKDFSKNIATYVTEVCKFDEQYEKEQMNESSETQDKDSASSNSEINENSSEEKTNEPNSEQSEGAKEESSSVEEEKEATQPNPDIIKKNDVNDKTKEKKNGEDEDGYLDLLGNGLLKRKVIEGEDVEDIKPYHGDIVTINTSGKLEDGTVVDTLEDLSFPVGEGDVIQAWDLGVMTTKVGQTIELTTDAKYAYGELGRKPDIPPNATITYMIKLTKKEEAPDINKLDVDERFNMAEKKRERGNEVFGRNDYAGAINSYNKAIKILESGSLQGTPTKLQDLADCRLKCCNNMAACQLKVEAYDAAMKSCQAVLDLQPENVKALFRLGKAHTAKGNTKEGIQYLQKAFRLEPESKVIKQEIKKLSQKISKETELEKNMYKKMLGTKTTTAAAASATTNPHQKSWKWAVLGGGVAAVVAAGLAAYRYGHH